MRPLEILVSILLALYLLWPHSRPVGVRLIPAVTLVIMVLHLYFEGYRWQMIPLYALTVLLAISSLAKITSLTDWSTASSSWIVIVLLVFTSIPILLPVPKIPTPSGPLAIGTVIYEFTDPARPELYSGKDEARRFMIQAWYPAEVKEEGERAPWMSKADVYAPAVATYIGLPAFFLDHLTLVNIPAYKNAQVAGNDAGYPVIIFSHGWNGFNAQNTGQALELASHGFVVIAVQHTYGAVTTVFADGTMAPNNPNALPQDADDPNYEVVARKLVNQWAGDISFTLDEFEDLNKDANNIFYNKLDMERIGVYGHSTGGGAAIQFCGTDPRCDALLGMDPFMRPVSAEVIENGVSQPSFFMFSQAWTDLVDSKNNQLFNQFHPEVADSVGAISINGTKHFDFSDLPLLSPIAPQLGLKGPLKGSRVIEIVNSYLLGFFEMTLNNNPSSLFGSSFNDFSEVKVR